MRRNGYICTSGVNLDTAVRFADPDFLFVCKISAIWRRFRWLLHLIFLMSAIFLLPVCLTYWSRKYATRVDPHVDNFHKVWSWCDHTLPSYTVFVCWYITWLCDLDFWPFDLQQLLCMGGHVTNCATKFEDPKPIRSWVMSYNVSRWLGLPLKMRTLLLRMRRITWPASRGSKSITFLESPTLICLYTMHFGGSTMNVIKVIWKNDARPCVKRRTSFCACAKLRDLLKVT